MKKIEFCIIKKRKLRKYILTVNEGNILIYRFWLKNKHQEINNILKNFKKRGIIKSIKLPKSKKEVTNKYLNLLRESRISIINALKKIETFK